MEAPPSRSSQESRLSFSSTLASSRSPSLSPTLSLSPCPLSSALSVGSEDLSVTVSEPGFDVQPYLDRLLPCITGLLSRFDRVNQIMDELHGLEVKLEETQSRRRKRRRSRRNQEEESRRVVERGGVREEERGQGEGRERRERKIGVICIKPRISLPSSLSFSPSTFRSFPQAPADLLPRTRSSYSESSMFQPHPSKDTQPADAVKPAPGSCGLGPYPAALPGAGRLPRRRAWHSGSSHSADAAQRAHQAPGGGVGYGAEGGAEASTVARPRSEEGGRRRISQGAPVKRKAWISEGPETDQD